MTNVITIAKKEMDLEGTKGIPHREKIAAKAYRSNVQQLALALFSCDHLYQFARDTVREKDHRETAFRTAASPMLSWRQEQFAA
jgi:hypothetical protein